MTNWPPRLLQKEALQQTESRLVAEPGNIALRMERARLLTELGQNEDAKNAYIDIIRQEPSHFWALSNLGNLLHAMGFKTAAITTYREVIAHHPHNSIGHVNLANALREKGDIATARQHYELVLQRSPLLAEAHQGMAYLLMELGEEEQARIHREQGFKDRAVTVLPYRGDTPPITVVLLISAMGGNVPIQPFLSDRIFLTTIVRAEFFDASTPLPEHQLVFNAVGDADLCMEAIDAAAKILAYTPAPIINAPDAVRHTSRIENAARLSQIAGVVTPKTALLPRATVTFDTLQQAGFSFPLLLRRPGFHGGHYFVRVENAHALPAALAQFSGDDVMVIEYIDARSADGKTRKYRVMMIDGTLYPLHAAISREWKIHYFSAEMADNPEHRGEDAAFLEDMPQVLGARAIEALEQIQATLGLDYAGIDFSLNAAGEVIVFEANATMTVAKPDSDARWDYRRAATERIFAAVHNLLTRRL